ncbi:unnamed protein product [Soboliphyme baturini]|uniref:Transmembrane protein n=1 Tax=Soboliphyme baturini TaxID=241478 RepID=A0A183IHA7_9BILA|nr:unnamed protein product [Soboliphyme baturini]
MLSDRGQNMRIERPFSSKHCWYAFKAYHQSINGRLQTEVLAEGLVAVAYLTDVTSSTTARQQSSRTSGYVRRFHMHAFVWRSLNLRRCALSPESRGVRGRRRRRRRKHQFNLDQDTDDNCDGDDQDDDDRLLLAPLRRRPTPRRATTTAAVAVAIRLVAPCPPQLPHFWKVRRLEMLSFVVSLFIAKLVTDDVAMAPSVSNVNEPLEFHFSKLSDACLDSSLSSSVSELFVARFQGFVFSVTFMWSTEECLFEILHSW